MKRVHQIVVSRDRTCRSLINLLRPVRCSDNDDGILVVLADYRNHRLGVRLDGLPVRSAVRLIADFIEYIIVVFEGL